jgi:hypothetical protein
VQPWRKGSAVGHQVIRLGDLLGPHGFVERRLREHAAALPRPRQTRIELRIGYQTVERFARRRRLPGPLANLFHLGRRDEQIGMPGRDPQPAEHNRRRLAGHRRGDKRADASQA